MNDQWPEEPLYFGIRDEPITDPSIIEGFLFCGMEGWRKPITDLVDDLFKLGWNGRLLQIKEKFGGLRFYIGYGDDEIYNRITQAENECDKLCMKCGEGGTLRQGGWWVTLCDKCYDLTKTKD